MKKISLVAVILLLVASVGITVAFPSRVSIKGFLLSVYSTAFENSKTQSVDAQTVGNGTFSIKAEVCQTLPNFSNTSDVTCTGVTSIPTSGYTYDIQRVVGQGASTVISSAVTGVVVGTQYSVPANTPNAGNNNRDVYMVIFKSAPTNYLYVRQGGSFDLPYTFSVTTGQNTEVVIPYVIYTATEQTAPVGTTFQADIVDGNGNFSRALTDSETQSVSFDVQHSVARSGGTVGSLSGNFDTQKSSGKLNTSYSLTTYVHTPSILTNIKSPSGYVVRSIDGGTYFDPELNPTVTIHFTKSPSSSSVQNNDQMLYVPNGISYVKKIAQTYSDNEYKYSNLDVDQFQYRGNDQRPFPINWVVAKYSGTPYLFMNGMGKIVVYDISNPANPVQKSEFLLSTLNKLNISTRHTGAGDVTSGQCDPEHGGSHAFFTAAQDVFAVNDSPYLLVNVDNTLTPGGMAILSINTSGMTLTAYPQWTQCYFNPNGVFGTAYGMYKGTDGNTYFVSQPFDNPGGGVGSPTAAILSVNSAGVVSTVSTLYKYNGTSGSSGVATDLNYKNVSVYHSGSKTYLIGTGLVSVQTISAPVYIYDISDPKNIIKVSQNLIADSSGRGRMLIDEQAGRLYVASSIVNPAATSTNGYFGNIPKTLPTWQAYDISNPSSPKLLTTYNKPADLLNSSQFSSELSEVAKRLNISSSGSLIDVNTSMSFIPAPYGSSQVQLISVSNNLAYLSIYTSGKTPWDLVANQAGKTDKSEYGTNVIQLMVDLTNISQPKIIGMIFGHNEYTMYGLSAGGWFDVPGYGSILNYNGYIYRANYRIADIWKFGNPPAQNLGGGGSTIPGNTGVTTGIQPTGTNAPAYSFTNLLNIFRRIFNRNAQQ